MNQFDYNILMQLLNELELESAKSFSIEVKDNTKFQLKIAELEVTASDERELYSLASKYPSCVTISNDCKNMFHKIKSTHVAAAMKEIQVNHQ